MKGRMTKRLAVEPCSGKEFCTNAFSFERNYP